MFHADDALAGALDALGGMVATAEFHPGSPSSWVTALDLAEALVERGVPFREAHHAVGAVVAHLAAQGRNFTDLDGDELMAMDARFDAADLERVDPAASVAARVSPGAGSMASVELQIAELRSLVEG